MIDAVSAVLLLSLPFIGQDPPAAPGADPVPAMAGEPLYTPPPVPPFEPPSDFGRETPQGDAAARPFRGPIAAAVSVDAYAGQYEAEPTPAEAGYAQGVAGAELTMDALAGPLGGRWWVIDDAGRPLLRLVLDDPGPGLAVQGAWRSEEASGTGPAFSVGREGDGVEILLETAGGLTLARVAGGWEGLLIGPDGRRRAVRLIR